MAKLFSVVDADNNSTPHTHKHARSTCVITHYQPSCTLEKRKHTNITKTKNHSTKRTKKRKNLYVTRVDIFFVRLRKTKKLLLE